MSTRYDPATVAAIARQAHTDHVPITVAVARHYQCRRAQAAKAIARARKAGHPIPKRGDR